MGKISRAKFARMMQVPLIDLTDFLQEHDLAEDIDSSEIKISNS